MDPAPLPGDIRIEQPKSSMKPWASITYNEPKLLALKPPLVEVVQEGLLGDFSFPFGLTKAQELPLALTCDPIGQEDESLLPIKNSLTNKRRYAKLRTILLTIDEFNPLLILTG